MTELVPNTAELGSGHPIRAILFNNGHKITCNLPTNNQQGELGTTKKIVKTLGIRCYQIKTTQYKDTAESSAVSVIPIPTAEFLQSRLQHLTTHI